MDTPQPRNRGPICPICGRAWSPGRATCPRCGFDQTVPAQEQWGLLTVFGYGLCGFVAGAEAGLAAAVATTAGPRLQHVATLAALGAGMLGLVAATAIGRRLVPAVRCAYEHLLLACDGAGLIMVGAAFAGVTGLQTMALLWVIAAAVTFALLRRYGYRVCQTRPRP